MMATAGKRLRIDDSSLRIANATHTLCIANQKFSDAVKVSPFRIKRSNATVGHGASFSKAFCDTEGFDIEFLFGDIFQTGIAVLTDYLYQKILPNDKKHKLIFGKLLDFMNEERKIKINPKTSITETELALILANHLFGKLSTSGCFMVHKSHAGEVGDQCLCDDRCCKMNCQYGDTTIGNAEVWHGNLDIIINNDLVVGPLTEPSHTPEEKALDRKVKESVLSENPQIVAQTIVYSFLKKKTHPERDNFLIPLIGVGNSTMVVMLYDSENDVILESSHIPLFQSLGSGEYKLDDAAILVSWLTVNYRFLCSGLTEEMKMCKGGFFAEAKDKLKVYEEKLQPGNIDTSIPVLNLRKKSLQISSFLEDEEKRLVEIIHREMRANKCLDSSTSDQTDGGPTFKN